MNIAGMSDPTWQKTGPSKIVNLGFIGAGFIGQLAHIANYAQIKNCRMVALAEKRPELRKKVAAHYNIPRTYATHQELLEDKDVDAVVAVTDRLGIGPVALDCLEAGKPLLTEKPMASTRQQAERLVEAAKLNGVMYVIGYMKRYDEGVQKAKDILDGLMDSRELGAMTYVRAHCFSGDAYGQCDGHIVTDEEKPTERETWPMAPDWVPEELRYDYHQYLNQYCHDINLLRYLLGKTPEVSHVQLTRTGVQVVTLDFADYAAVLETGQCSHQGWDEVIEIYFEKGSLRLKMPPPLLRNVSAEVELYKGEPTQKSFLPSQRSWAFRRQAQAYIQDVYAKRESLSSGADALEDMRVVEEIWRRGISKTPEVCRKEVYGG